MNLAGAIWPCEGGNICLGPSPCDSRGCSHCAPAKAGDVPSVPLRKQGPRTKHPAVARQAPAFAGAQLSSSCMRRAQPRLSSPAHAGILPMGSRRLISIAPTPNPSPKGEGEYNLRASAPLRETGIKRAHRSWIPACAGMTRFGAIVPPSWRLGANRNAPSTTAAHPQFVSIQGKFTDGEDLAMLLGHGSSNDSQFAS